MKKKILMCLLCSSIYCFDTFCMVKENKSIEGLRTLSSSGFNEIVVPFLKNGNTTSEGIYTGAQIKRTGQKYGITTGDELDKKETKEMRHRGKACKVDEINEEELESALLHMFCLDENKLNRNMPYTLFNVVDVDEMLANLMSTNPHKEFKSMLKFKKKIIPIEDIELIKILTLKGLTYKGLTIEQSFFRNFAKYIFPAVKKCHDDLKKVPLHGLLDFFNSIPIYNNALTEREILQRKLLKFKKLSSNTKQFDEIEPLFTCSPECKETSCAAEKFLTLIPEEVKKLLRKISKDMEKYGKIKLKLKPNEMMSIHSCIRKVMGISQKVEDKEIIQAFDEDHFFDFSNLKHGVSLTKQLIIHAKSSEKIPFIKAPLLMQTEYQIGSKKHEKLIPANEIVEIFALWVKRSEEIVNN